MLISTLCLWRQQQLHLSMKSIFRKPYSSSQCRCEGVGEIHCHSNVETVELATCSGGVIHGVGKTGFMNGKYGSKSKGCDITGVVSADTMIIKCGSSTYTLSK